MHVCRLIAYNEIADNPFHSLDWHDPDYAPHLVVLYGFCIVEFVVASDSIPQNTVALHRIVEYWSYLIHEPLSVVRGITLIQEPASYVYYHTF